MCIFQPYRHLTTFKSTSKPISKTREDHKLHGDEAAPGKCLTERHSKSFWTYFRSYKEACEMEKLGWILGTLLKNEIH
jgi:hypothetical protein